MDRCGCTANGEAKGHENADSPAHRAIMQDGKPIRLGARMAKLRHYRFMSTRPKLRSVIPGPAADCPRVRAIFSTTLDELARASFSANMGHASSCAVHIGGEAPPQCSATLAPEVFEPGRPKLGIANRCAECFDGRDTPAGRNVRGLSPHVCVTTCPLVEG